MDLHWEIAPVLLWILATFPVTMHVIISCLNFFFQAGEEKIEIHLFEIQLKASFLAVQAMHK